MGSDIRRETLKKGVLPIRISEVIIFRLQMAKHVHTRINQSDIKVGERFGGDLISDKLWNGEIWQMSR